MTEIILAKTAGFCFGVDLQEADVRLQFGGGALECWGHGMARPTPVRPEICDDGQAVAADMAIERGLVDFDGLALKQGCLAPAAFWPVAELGLGNAVDARAGWARHQQRFGHANVLQGAFA